MDITGNKISGLTSQESIAALSAYGYNELKHTSTPTLFPIIFQLFREPMFLLLVFGATIYFILGDHAESLMLLSFVLVVMGITCYQEYHSEKAIIALRNLTSPRALVIREGAGVRVAGREVVPGDVMFLSEGDIVAADSHILAGSNLVVSEAILSGESRPIDKFSGDIGGDQSVVYSGSQVLQGSCYAKVFATGANSEIGKIGKSLENIKVERTKLQYETDLLVKKFSVVGSLICILVVVVYSLTRANWMGGVLVGIALAMAILPEELPVVITVFLALGAKKLGLSKVLTRRLPAVEALGSATVLCVDKTGTITQNVMSVDRLLVDNNIFMASIDHVPSDLPENFHRLLEYALLACQRNPFDSMDIALKSFSEYYLQGSDNLHGLWQMVHQYPISNQLLAISQVWQSKHDNEYVIAAKGAPEDIFDLCHLEQHKIDQLNDEINLMAKDGLRIIGVARAIFSQASLPSKQHDFNFEFLGLIAFADPVRPNIAEAIKSCYLAGIRVIMITGDHLGTARQIADKIGLNNYGKVIVGSELDSMTDAGLIEQIKSCNIFARILPQQKLRIVNALKANGESVAMTGDGVNDAPALKAAHIGVAMGLRGSDVARESADLVLLDDDFSSLVSAIKLGRRIYANIRKAIVYLVAVHLPIIGMTLIPVLFNLPLLLFPVHIVFLELIIDSSCSIIFENAPEEKDLMRKSPRKNGEKLFDQRGIIRGCIQGLVVLGFGTVLLVITRSLGWGDAEVRSLIFVVLVLSNLILVFINLIRRSILVKEAILHNRALWIILFMVLGSLSAIVTVAPLQKLFYF